MAILHPSPMPVLKGLLALLACGGTVLVGLGSDPSPVWAQSQLLESVKQNPARAKALCSQLRGFNAEGLSATSPQAVAQIARQENLSPMDAEVLTTYVVGLHCPDVR